MSTLVRRISEGGTGWAGGFCYGILGRDCGPNFHPDAPVFEEGVRVVENFLNTTRGLVGLRVAFVNQLATLEGAVPIALSEASIRTATPADCLFMTTKTAKVHNVCGIMIANADCPLIGVRAYKDGKLIGFGGAHAGFRNLIPDLRDAPNVLQVLLNEVSRHAPDKVRVFVFGGIGKCCYGVSADAASETVALCRDGLVVNRTVKHGPRASDISLWGIDLYKVARCVVAEAARLHGVNLLLDNWDTRCTACDNGNPYGSPYHSNVYAAAKIPDGKGGEQNPRNLSFFAPEW